MFEFDMLTGEFLDDDTSAPAGIERREPMLEPWLELRLLSVDEAEAARLGRR
jgi:hypothetical protein